MSRPLLLLAAGLGLTVVPGVARATYCEGSPRIVGLPGYGGRDVPPGSSIFVSWHLQPSLRINGRSVETAAYELLGRGDLVSWWRVKTEFLPGTRYDVSVEVNGGLGVTSFTTGMPSEAKPAAPVKPARLRLWRVRFPEDRTRSPYDCILDDHEGYIDLDYQPGIVPGTPEDEVVNVIELKPRGGVEAQRYVRAGLPVPLVRWEDPSPDRPGNPEGRYPSPRDSLWKPQLLPDQEYCATVSLYGRNDRVAPPVTSEPVCAPVMNILWGGGSPDAGPSDAALPEDGGTKIAPAGHDAGATGQPPGADAKSADATPSPAGGACALAGRGGTALWPLPLLVLLATCRLVGTRKDGARRSG